MKKKSSKSKEESSSWQMDGEPKLLAGGNPQIPKGDGDAPVAAYIQAMPGWKHDTGRALDNLIVATVPNLRKSVRWNSPFYGTEENSWFLNMHCLEKYIKVAFFRGTSLKPIPPIDSKHESTRYFHIFEADTLDDELLGNWIRQASKLPGLEDFTW